MLRETQHWTRFGRNFEISERSLISGRYFYKTSSMSRGGGGLSGQRVWLWADALSVRVPLAELNTSAFPKDWVIKGPGMSSRVCAIGHITDPVPLIEKRRGLSPGGRFPPSFIHQVIITTGLNKLYNLCSRPEDGLRCRQGVKPPLKLKTTQSPCSEPRAATFPLRSF